MAAGPSSAAHIVARARMSSSPAKDSVSAFTTSSTSFRWFASAFFFSWGSAAPFEAASRSRSIVRSASPAERRTGLATSRTRASVSARAEPRPFAPSEPIARAAATRTRGSGSVRARVSSGDSIPNDPRVVAAEARTAVSGSSFRITVIAAVAPFASAPSCARRASTARIAFRRVDGVGLFSNVRRSAIVKPFHSGGGSSFCWVSISSTGSSISPLIRSCAVLAASDTLASESAAAFSTAGSAARAAGPIRPSARRAISRTTGDGSAVFSTSPVIVSLALGPTRTIADAIASRTSASDSWRRRLMRPGIVFSAFGPILAIAAAQSLRTLASLSDVTLRSSVVDAGSAAVPISPSAKAAALRTGGSVSRSAFWRSGTAARASAPILARSRAAWRREIELGLFSFSRSSG